MTLGCNTHISQFVFGRGGFVTCDQLLLHIFAVKGKKELLYMLCYELGGSKKKVH